MSLFDEAGIEQLYTGDRISDLMSMMVTSRC